MRWRRGRSGGWEIDGIDDDVLREFSQRRNEIEDAVAELEAEIGRRSSLDEVQAVITGSRPAKKDVDPSTLVDGWWARARRRGLTPEALGTCTGRAPEWQLPTQDDLFARLASPNEGVCAGHSLFTRSDVLTALADLDHDDQPLPIDATTGERLADEFLASSHVVQLDTSEAGGASPETRCSPRERSSTSSAGSPTGSNKVSTPADDSPAGCDRRNNRSARPSDQRATGPRPLDVRKRPPPPVRHRPGRRRQDQHDACRSRGMGGGWVRSRRRCGEGRGRPPPRHRRRHPDRDRRLVPRSRRPATHG